MGRSCLQTCYHTRKAQRHSLGPHPTLLEADRKPTAGSDGGGGGQSGPSLQSHHSLIQEEQMPDLHVPKQPSPGSCPLPETTAYPPSIFPSSLSVGSTAEHVHVQISNPFLKSTHTHTHTRTPLYVTGDHRSQHWPRPAPHPNTICRSGQFLYTANKSHHQPYQVTGPPRLCRPCSALVCLGSQSCPGRHQVPLALPVPPALPLNRKPLSRPR